MGRSGTDYLNFDYHPTSRVRFGAGSLNQIGAIAKGLGGTRVFVVSDEAIERAGYLERACSALKTAGCDVATYVDIAPDPAAEDVAATAAAARAWGGVDLLVGLGGGSVMDTAKAINFLLCFGGEMEDYWGSNMGKGTMLPSIGVPTTAGTGSESQSYALIKQGDGKKRKMACGDIEARFSDVILDPELLVTVPERAICHAGVDAITHAVESFVSTARSPMSCMFAREALVLMNRSFEKVLADRNDLVAQGDMLLGAHLAGLAIENSMLGAAHASGNVLTYQMELSHGEAVGVMLPWVMRYNAPACEDAYADLARSIGFAGTAEAVTAQFIKRIDLLFGTAQIPKNLRELGFDTLDASGMAEQAVKEWTGTFNPKKMGVADFERLFESAY